MQARHGRGEPRTRLAAGSRGGAVSPSGALPGGASHPYTKPPGWSAADAGAAPGRGHLLPGPWPPSRTVPADLGQWQGLPLARGRPGAARPVATAFPAALPQACALFIWIFLKNLLTVFPFRGQSWQRCGLLLFLFKLQMLYILLAFQFPREAPISSPRCRCHGDSPSL